jgi:hypothetical protein
MGETSKGLDIFVRVLIGNTWPQTANLLSHLQPRNAGTQLFRMTRRSGSLTESLKTSNGRKRQRCDNARPASARPVPPRAS